MVLAPISVEPTPSPESEEASRKRLAGKWALLIAITFVPVLPFFVFGYDGHDYLFHAPSWLEIAQQWRLGIPFPRWAALANYGLGDPHFCFYPPLTQYLGGLFMYGLPHRIVPGLMIWLACVAAAASMYRLADEYVAPERRMGAAALYVLSPYVVSCADIRFAVADLFVAAILPLILLYYFRMVNGQHPSASFKLALLLAAVWLTDIPVAIELFYLFAFLSVAKAMKRKTWKPLWSASPSANFPLLCWPLSIWVRC